MKNSRKTTRKLIIPAYGVMILLLIMAGCNDTTSSVDEINENSIESHTAPFPERTGTTKVHSDVSLMSMHGEANFSDLTSGLTADDLAANLVGPGVNVSNVTYTGHNQAAGTFEFTGDHDVIGISSGIVLSSGKIIDAEGHNSAPNTRTAFRTPGDADLNDLSSFTTYDAAILEFDFTVEANAEKIFIQYVFGSEEYNEYVGTPFNDVFAFFVNGENCAVVGDASLAVSINTINNGANPNASPYLQIIEPTNPDLYINNDPRRPDISGTTVPYADLLYTEMDGFTVVLVCESEVNAGETNTMKLAIADANDYIYDSWVFLGEGSLTTTPPTTLCVDLIAAQDIVAGNVCAVHDQDNLYVTYNTFDDWMLEETHLAVSKDDVGSGEWSDNGWTNRRGNPAPGQFPNIATHDPAVDDTYTYTIPLSDISGGITSTSELFIGAHAVVTNNIETETAWGEGPAFIEQGNWAMYFEYEVLLRP